MYNRIIQQPQDVKRKLFVAAVDHQKKPFRREESTCKTVNANILLFHHSCCATKKTQVQCESNVKVEILCMPTECLRVC